MSVLFDFNSNFSSQKRGMFGELHSQNEMIILTHGGTWPQLQGLIYFRKTPCKTTKQKNNSQFKLEINQCGTVVLVMCLAIVALEGER